MKKFLVLVLSLALFFSCDFLGENVDPNGNGNGNGNELPEMTTAQKEAAAEALMDDGKLDEALTAYDEIIQLDDASADASIRWSMLKLASISVHQDVRTLASDLGVQDYPTTMNEALGADSTMDPMSAMPTVENSHMFTQFDDEYSTVSPMIALLYNMKNSYPDGFDPMMDGFVNATAVLDEIIVELGNLSPNASFTLTYDMIFPGEEYDPYYSSWPGENGQPQEIVLGKAEILLFAASLEGVRAFAYAANSISMRVDLDGYWDIFNPVDGDFYEFDEFGDIVGVNESYDFENFQDPIKYGLLETSDDAAEMLEQSRIHFANVFRFIKEAGDLIAARTVSDDFFISPSMVGEDVWPTIVDANATLGILMDKVIDSIENNTTIYIPMPPEEVYNEYDEYVSGGFNEDYILSLGNLNNWPTQAGEGVIAINLGNMFEKPLFAIENLIELDGTKGFVIYDITDEENAVVATSYTDGNSYALKLVDNTFNGVIDENIASMIPEYIPLPVLFAATELTAAGENYVVNGVTYISEGSVFKLIKYIDDDIAFDAVDVNLFENQYLRLNYISYYDENDDYITGSSPYWALGYDAVYALFDGDSSTVTYYYVVNQYNEETWEYEDVITYKTMSYEISGFDVIVFDGTEIGDIYADTWDDGESLYLEIVLTEVDTDDVDYDGDTLENIYVEYDWDYANLDFLPNLDSATPVVE